MSITEKRDAFIVGAMWGSACGQLLKLDFICEQAVRAYPDAPVVAEPAIYAAGMAKRIGLRMMQLDLTCAQVGASVGVHEGTVARWRMINKKNARNVGQKHVAPLAKALGVSPQWLQFGESDGK